ncbi:GTPase [Xanthobacter variabilis]|uniref:GTPase n=1 Tax=Xanthobacter variabilis TaxID=3119932 RepID=UPI00374E6FE5
MSARSGDEARRDILAILPGRAHDLARLQELAQDGEPIVTVIGKYNHGKSRLLNELVSRDVFVVADKRQTTTLSQHLSHGVRWLDAPGLDADVANEDDRQALQAAWLKSDIRLFVHTAKQGELDETERRLLEELCADEQRTRRQVLFVLSQIDQLADDGELASVLQALTIQVPHIAPHVVSATRHRHGVEAGKTLLVEKSGMPSLRTALDEALARVPAARSHETGLLFTEIREELQQLSVRREQELAALRQKQQRLLQNFKEGLDAVFAKVGREIEEVVNAPIPDYALIPDTAQDKYKTTEAKLERARIQIGYSRACIQIDSFLIGQGVSGLPKEQQTAAGSLNTVMVAVMGVSVKFRNDLRRMFCEAPGRERLQGEFTRYFELSEASTVLRAKIALSEIELKAMERAVMALETLETGA